MRLNVCNNRLVPVLYRCCLYYTIPDFGDLLPEISFWKRIAPGWGAFGKLLNIMRSRKASKKIKKKINNQYILLVMTHSCETWALNNAMMEKLAVAQRKIERIMLGIALRDRKRNTWTRQETGVSKIINIIPGKQRIEGQVTSQGYLITVGPSEQQSGPHESGPENRVVQKQDEETILPDSLDPYGQD